MSPIINPVVLVVGLLQMVASGWAFWTGDWKLGVINLCVGIANSTLSTLAVK